MSDEKQSQQKIDINLPTAAQLLEAGVHFGHRTSRWNPKMKPYIFGVKNAVHIIDLDKTITKLKEAIDFIVDLVNQGSVILFVGTKPAVKKIIKEAAESCQMPYVTERWLGGTLTNFKTISKRLEYFKDLESKIAEGQLQKYTKKEQLGFQKELEGLRKNFEGIKNLTKTPQAIFLVDLKENQLAAKEAKKTGTALVAICDTNTDPSLVDWPIPGNDDAASAVKIIVETIAEAISQAKNNIRVNS